MSHIAQHDLISHMTGRRSGTRYIREMHEVESAMNEYGFRFKGTVERTQWERWIISNHPEKAYRLGLTEGSA